MSITLKTLPLPTIGTDAHSVSTLQPLLSAITQNLNTLKTAIEGLETTVASSKVEYLQDTVPDAANVGDKWFKTDNPTLSLVTKIEGFANVQAYAIVDGLTVPQKEARWKPLTDSSTESTIVTLQTVLDGKITSVQSDDPPATLKFGDIWIQTLAGKQNQVHTCKTAYDFSGSGGTPHGPSPTAWTQGEIDTYFRPSGDPEALGAANLAQGTADGKRAAYLRDQMPGVDVGDAGLIFEPGDEWADTDDPDFSTYYCFLGYSASDPFLPDLATFQAAHWRLKGDPSSRALAQAANALADGKTTTYRQLTAPLDAKLLDVWFKNFDPPDDYKDELFVNNEGDYTDAYIQANYVTEGHPTAEAFRQSFWRKITDPNALQAANDAAALAGTKSTNHFSNEPPDVANNGDTWTDLDGVPIKSYICILGYDYAGSSPIWTVDGAHNPPTAPKISTHWQVQLDPTLEGQAASARAIVDGKRMTFTGETPPENSGIVDPDTGNFIDVDVGDLFVRVTEELTDNGPDSFSIYVCYRSYNDIGGIGFIGTGPDVDGLGNLLDPGDGGFNTQNAYNYWKQTRDKGAIEFALDIQALKDGKRTIYFSDSRDVKQSHGHSSGIPDLAIALGGIQLGDIWVDEGSVDPVVAQAQIDALNPDYGKDPVLGYFQDLPSGQRIYQFQVYKCRVAYAYDEALPADRFLGKYANPDALEGEWINWLAVDEPEIRLQAIKKASFENDGQRSIFVTHGVVPNPNVGLPNWQVGVGATLGDVWIDISTYPAKPKRYICVLAYVSGGTIANWEREDNVVTDPGNPNSPASVAYIDANVIKRDGSNSPSANISWANNKLIDLADGAIAGGSKEAVNGGQLKTVKDNIDAHETLTNNPHGVTAAQTGAVPSGGNVSLFANDAGYLTLVTNPTIRHVSQGTVETVGTDNDETLNFSLVGVGDPTYSAILHCWLRYATNQNTLAVVFVRKKGETLWTAGGHIGTSQVGATATGSPTYTFTLVDASNRQLTVELSGVTNNSIDIRFTHSESNSLRGSALGYTM